MGGGYLAFVEGVAVAIGRPVEVEFAWGEEPCGGSCGGVVPGDGVLLGLVVVVVLLRGRRIVLGLILGLVLGLRIVVVVVLLWGGWVVLGLGLVPGLRSGCRGGHGQVSPARHESVLARGVGHSPSLPARVHVAVGATSVPAGVALLLELDAVLLRVRGAERAVPGQEALLAEDGRRLRGAVIIKYSKNIIFSPIHIKEFGVKGRNFSLVGIIEVLSSSDRIPMQCTTHKGRTTSSPEAPASPDDERRHLAGQRSGDAAQGGQEQEQFAEAQGLVGVRRRDVLAEGELGLILEGGHRRHVHLGAAALEEHDQLHVGVLLCVDSQLPELGERVLEGLHLVQQRGGHARELRQLQRQHELSRSKHEQLAPALLQQRQLVLEVQSRERRHALHPRHERYYLRGLRTILVHAGVDALAQSTGPALVSMRLVDDTAALCLGFANVLTLSPDGALEEACTAATQTSFNMVPEPQKQIPSYEIVDSMHNFELLVRNLGSTVCKLLACHEVTEKLHHLMFAFKSLKRSSVRSGGRLEWEDGLPAGQVRAAADARASVPRALSPFCALLEAKAGPTGSDDSYDLRVALLTDGRTGRAFLSLDEAINPRDRVSRDGVSFRNNVPLLLILLEKSSTKHFAMYVVIEKSEMSTNYTERTLIPKCGIEEIWVENVFEWHKGSSRSTIIDELFKREEDDDADGRLLDAGNKTPEETAQALNSDVMHVNHKRPRRSVASEARGPSSVLTKAIFGGNVLHFGLAVAVFLLAYDILNRRRRLSFVRYKKSANAICDVNLRAQEIFNANIKFYGSIELEFASDLTNVSRSIDLKIKATTFHCCKETELNPAARGGCGDAGVVTDGRRRWALPSRRGAFVVHGDDGGRRRRLFDAEFAALDGGRRGLLFRHQGHVLLVLDVEEGVLVALARNRRRHPHGNHLVRFLRVFFSFRGRSRRGLAFLGGVDGDFLWRFFAADDESRGR
ncbi:hypothetical protein C0J52_19903 [Blattella germanica]|nr:hypothetical protein C0J52_19903 [Blattella germanica]